MKLKQQIAAYLDDSNTHEGRWGTLTIALLILVSAAIFVVETYDIPPSLQIVFSVMDWTILSLFTVEYGLRLWSADLGWAYALSPYGLIDLVAILPFLLGFLDMRFVRLLRWLRVLRLIRLLGDRAVVGRLTASDTLAVVRIVFTLFAIIFIYAGIIFQVEENYHPETFGSFLDAAYFAVVTMTTVGYGDITPVSIAGRWFTVMMILTGIALIPTELGDLIRRIVKMSQAVQTPCSQCGWTLHDIDARFCKHCGTRLSHPDKPVRFASDSPPWTSSLPFAPRSSQQEAPSPDESSETDAAES